MKHFNANGHAMPVKSDGVTKLQSDKLFQDDQNLPNCIPLEFGKSGRINQSISDQKCTANVPLVYGECTGGVLKRYWKGTTNVLRRYWKGTKDLLSVGTPRVPRYRTDRQSVGHDRTRVRGGDYTAPGSVGALFDCCSTVLRQLFDYESKRTRSGLEEQSKPTRSGLEQESNKSRSDVEEIGLFQGFLYRTTARLNADIRRGGKSFARIKWANIYLPLHMLLFFVFHPFVCFQRMMKNKAIRLCVYGFVSLLFNNAALAQSHENGGAVPTWAGLQAVEQVMADERLIKMVYKYDPTANLIQFPPIVYKVNHNTTSDLKIGDKLPNALLDLPLWVVDSQQNRDVVSLREFDNEQLVVLDFWSMLCAPCIESVDKWEAIADSLGSAVQLLPVQLDFDYRALKTATDRGWKSPMVIGRSAYLLNSYFFDRPVISRIVWVKGGRVLAITGTKGYDLEMVRGVIAGKDVDIPIAYEWTYSQSKP